MSRANGGKRLESLVETRGVEGVYLVSNDGFPVLMEHPGNADPESVAAVSAVAAVTCARVGDHLALGNLESILLEYREGSIVVAARDEGIWVVAGNAGMVVGEVLLKLDRT